MEFKIHNRKILVVEDDSAYQSEIARFLRCGNNEIIVAASLQDAVKAIEIEKNLDAVILDVRLPDGSGLELFKRCKPLPPVVVLSMLGSDEQILSGLYAGAVDYVVKPCSMKLLETRLALRLLPKEVSYLVFDNLTVDSVTRIVRYNEQPIYLTSSEFNILLFLATHSGKFFLSDEIYENVWDAPSLRTTTIKRHLSTLRHKLKAAAPDEELIVTEFGKGYCFLKRRIQ